MISYNEYISKYTRNSELRSRFVYFVESGFRLCPVNRQVEIQPNLRNYKLIAALGYLDLGLAPDLKEIFENGIEWIIGRQIDSSEPMIYDNVAIM